MDIIFVLLCCVVCVCELYLLIFIFFTPNQNFSNIASKNYKTYLINNANRIVEFKIKKFTNFIIALSVTTLLTLHIYCIG